MQEQTHGELSKIVRMRREANEHKHEAHSQSILKKHITTKFRTTMIGSLAHFEEIFGMLWGHGKRNEDLTEEELEWKEKWMLARTEILNNGNDQLRASLNEIDQYTVKFNKNEYTFRVKDKKGLIEDE